MYVGCYKQDSSETDTSQYAAHFTAEQPVSAPSGVVNHNTKITLPLHCGCACCAAQPCQYIRLTVVASLIFLRCAATHYRHRTPTTMDPISALSLSAAILQFVDFGSKIVVATYKIYRSADGTTNENVELAELTTALHEFQTRLATPRSYSANQDADQKALEELAARCRDIATELLHLLEDLKVKVKDEGFRHTWESLRQGCRTEWKKGKIARYEKLLRDIAVQLNSRLLSLIL